MDELSVGAATVGCADGEQVAPQLGALDLGRCEALWCRHNLQTRVVLLLNKRGCRADHR